MILLLCELIGSLKLESCWSMMLLILVRIEVPLEMRALVLLMSTRFSVASPSSSCAVCMQESNQLSVIV